MSQFHGEWKIVEFYNKNDFFSGKIWSKKHEIYLLKMKFDNQTNPSMLNSLVTFGFPVTDQK